VEREHSRAGRGEHPSHLVIAPLGEGKQRLAGTDHPQLSRSAWLVLALEPQGTGGENAGQIRREIAIDGGAVDLGHLVAWRSEAMDECRQIGEQQCAAGFLVEPAHAGHDRVSPAPAFRKQRVNRGSLALVVGADETGRLVKQQQEPVGMVRRFTVDADFASGDALPGVACRVAADGHTTGAHPVAGLAAAAIAEVGEKLVEAAHRNPGKSGYGEEGSPAGEPFP